MSCDHGALRALFTARYGAPPDVGARAPGRVNLIGEHTDYNGGYVLPFAIDRETVVLGRRRDDQLLRLYAENQGAETTLDLARLRRSSEAPWADYVAGVAHELHALGHELPGCDLLIAGDVPIGCGLSSSAALEMAVLKYFEILLGARLEDGEAARLGQRVENEYLGLSSGIMDQYVSRAARAGHAVYLDCATLKAEHIPIALKEAVFVIADSASPRGLTDSAYNTRVSECAEAVALINAATGRAFRHLSEVPAELLTVADAEMREVVLRRKRHVVTENGRTRAACRALRAGDVRALGDLMNASHDSLREDYEVTGEALDTLVEIARDLPGCHGARMTGAGFGGCTIHLVDRTAAPRFMRELREGYGAATGRTSLVFEAEASGGADALIGWA